MLSTDLATFRFEHYTIYNTYALYMKTHDYIKLGVKFR